MTGAHQAPAARDARWQRDLVDIGRASRREAGHTLVRPGEVSEVVLIRAGHVMVTGAGRAALVLGPGEVLGPVAATREPSAVAAVALTDIETLSVPGPAWEAHLAAHPEIAVELLAAGQDRLDAAHQRLARACHTAEHRLAAVLLDLIELGVGAGTASRPVELPLTQADLAALADMSLETVKKTLRGMRGRGLLDTGRRVLTVPNPDTLRHHAAALPHPNRPPNDADEENPPCPCPR
uniref:Crp/Fnr family transcriptional regulator n=1 Tax=Actinokineospora sp. CA-119265 TaxID=3239890 RepID=UPI003F491EFA